MLAQDDSSNSTPPAKPMRMRMHTLAMPSNGRLRLVPIMDSMTAC